MEKLFARRRKKLDAPGGWHCLKYDHDRMKEKKSVAERRGRDKPSSRNLETSWR